jgi:uncharacterized protein YjbI with pentapeptide repeats
MIIVFIHKNVPDRDYFISCLNEQIIPILYDDDNTSFDTYLKDYPVCDHYGFIYDNRMSTFPFGNGDNTHYRFFNDHFFNYFLNYNDSDVRTIDIITCDIKSLYILVEIDDIETKYNINIRYSLNGTGNLNKSDWILESDGVSIKEQYFTNKITTWYYSLGSLNNHNALIKTDNKVYCFGDNRNGQCGQSTRNDKIQEPTLVSLPTGTTILSIAVGGRHTLVTDNSRNVWCWGDNSNGQLGNGSSGASTNATPYKILTGLIYNNDNTTTNIDFNNIVGISCGNSHSVFLDTSGNVFTCGSNDNGQLGLENYVSTSVPTRNKYFNRNGIYIIAITAGGDHTLCLSSTGSVYSFGLNDKGQLGIGSNTRTHTPTKITTLLFDTNIKIISAGDKHSACVDGDGKLWTFGYNGEGQLGLGDRTDRNIPVMVTNSQSSNGSDVSSFPVTKLGYTNKIIGVSCGSNHTIVTDMPNAGFSLSNPTSGKNIYATGKNSSGQIGYEDESRYTKFIPVPSGNNEASLSGCVTMYGGDNHSIFISYKGKVYANGDNTYYQLSASSSVDELKTPTNVNRSFNSLIKNYINNDYTYSTNINGVVLQPNLNLSNVDLSSSDLSGIDLSGTSLVNANLVSSNLSGVTLTNANLSGATISNVILSNANLSGAILTNSNLSGSILTGSRLSGSKLKGSKLHSSNLQQSNMSDCDLSGAEMNSSNLSNCNMPRAKISNISITGASFISSNLSYCNFNGSNINSSNLKGASLKSSYYSNCSIQNSYLSDCDMSDSELTGTNLSGSRFTRAKLCRANIINANLSGTSFISANLLMANLSHSNLNSSNLYGARLSNSKIKSASIKSTKLNNAHLSDCSISDASMSDCSVRSCNMTGCKLMGNLRNLRLINSNLTSSNLCNSTFSNSNLSYSNFTRANLSNSNLHNCQNTNTKYKNTNLRGVSFINANLTYSHLSDCSMNEADLSDCSITDSHFSKIRCNRTRFTRTRIVRSNLKSTQLKQCNFSDADLSDCSGSDVDFSSTTHSNSRIRGCHFRRPNLLYSNLYNCDFLNTELSEPELTNVKIVHTKNLNCNQFGEREKIMLLKNKCNRDTPLTRGNIIIDTAPGSAKVDLDPSLYAKTFDIIVPDVFNNVPETSFTGRPAIIPCMEDELINIVDDELNIRTKHFGNLFGMEKLTYRRDLITGDDYVIPNTELETINGYTYTVFFGSLTYNPVDTSVCFLRGTRILTPTGYVNVEALKIGDKLVRHNRLQTRITKLFSSKLPANNFNNPIKIPKGMYGAIEDLYVSPNHMVYNGEVMVKAKNLVGCSQIYVGEVVEYYHVKTRNEIMDTLVANGVFAESYMENYPNSIIKNRKFREYYYRVKIDKYSRKLY